MSNRYTYSVPFTAGELHADYVVSGMTQVEIARKWSVSQKVVWRALLKAGIASRKAAPRNQRLERNNNWRGGVTLSPATGKRAPFLDRGYRLVYKPEHPHAMKAGYVYEHVLVALNAASLERLPQGHCVHHINLRKDDNRPENLEICSHKIHQAHHTKLEELAVQLLLDTGKVKFIPGVGYVEA